MNGIFNKTRLWYCDLSDKTINFISRLRYSSFNSHKYGTLVTEYEFNKPKIVKLNYILNDTIKDCLKNSSFIWI